MGIHDSVARREFLKIGAAAAAGMVLPAAGRAAPDDDRPVRIGCVGVGRRGTGLLGTLLSMQGVEIPAVCDIDAGAAARAQDLVARSKRAKPELYTRGDEDYQRLMDRKDLDAVLIATPWQWHTPMAVAAMKVGKYAAVEVPCAITLDQCWDLVKTHEATGVPCMMLENWSFRRDNLAVLNMIRKGLFGGDRPLSLCPLAQLRPRMVLRRHRPTALGRRAPVETQCRPISYAQPWAGLELDGH